MEQATAKREPAHLKGNRGRKEGVKAPWDQIKAGIASGLSFQQVAKQFAQCHPGGWESLDHVIRKRAQRESWFVPRTAMALAKEKLAQSGVDVSAMSGSNVSASSANEKVGTLLVQSLEEMGQEGSLIAGELVLNQLRAAQASPERIAPLVDVKDITSAAKLVRLVAGMDKQGPAVSLSLWGGPMSPPGTSRDNVRDVSGSVLDDWEA